MTDQSSDLNDYQEGASGRSAPALDGVDNQIIGVLGAEGRISIRTLASRLNISRSAAYARLDRLLADGVITGFGARVSPSKAGLGTSAHVGLTIEQNAWREVADRLAVTPGVEHVALIAGDFDVLALVRTRDNSALRDLVFHNIQSLPGVISTRTWLIFDEFTPTTQPSGRPPHRDAP